MKVIGLVLGLVLVTSLCFAGVDAEIVAQDLDANGNIRVWSQYKIDGVEVQSNYPKKDGKFVYCTRYTAISFAGMNDAEIKTRILEDVDSHLENLIQKTYILKANDEIAKNNLKELIGTKSSKTTTKIELDLNKDGVKDKEWTLKTDGTKTEKDI